MKSIREIYNIGYGPSSSHTMGPSRAAVYFRDKNPDAEKYRITLYGSLALTGDRMEAGRNARKAPERDVVRGFDGRSRDRPLGGI